MKTLRFSFDNDDDPGEGVYVEDVSPLKGRVWNVRLCFAEGEVVEMHFTRKEPPLPPPETIEQFVRTSRKPKRRKTL